MYNFPDSPTLNQVFGNYTWDGEKWKQTSTGILPSSTPPSMDGASSAGTSLLYARGDHVHPTDTKLLPKAGGTLTGTLNATFINATGIASTDNININAASASFGLNKAASGQANTINGFTNGSLRWVMALGDSSAESGSNAGSNFGIYPATDAGAVAGAAALSIVRSSGVVSVLNSLNLNWTAPNGAIVSNSAAAGVPYLQLDQAGNFLYGGGTGTAMKPGGGTWTVSSDARIKDVQGDYTPGLAEITQLRPVVYTYKGNDAAEPDSRSLHASVADSQTPFVGLIAQEVEPIFPGLVLKSEGYIDGVKVDDLRSLDTSPLVFALVNSCKELLAKNNALEVRLAAIEEQINAGR